MTRKQQDSIYCQKYTRKKSQDDPSQMQLERQHPPLLSWSIFNYNSLFAVAQSLEENNSVLISTRVIMKFLSLVLNLNNFTFDDDNYLQIKGCDMGSKCSSLYADIFTGKFETNRIYPLINGKHLCYYHF